MPVRISAQKVYTPVGDSLGEWPTSETTGAVGTLTTSSLDTFNVTDGVYDSMHYTYTGGGSIQITADGTTFTNCRFASHVLVNEVDAATLTDCTFDGGISISSSRNVNVTRAKVENFSPDDALHVTNDGTSFDNLDIKFEDCYVYNAEAGTGAHADGLQVRGSLRLVVRNCYIDLGEPEFEHNAALYLEAGAPGGTNDDWLIENCYFKSGYGATLYISGAGGPGIFRNNTIAPAAPPVGGDTEATDLSTRPQTAYMNAAAPGDVTASGNVDENGDPFDVHNP